MCVIKHQAKKTYRGVELQLHIFIISALDGGEWSASRPGGFTTGVRTLSTHFTGGCVDWLERTATKKLSLPLP